MDNKKRRVLSYENMDEALRAAFEAKYPKGVVDYLPEANRYVKPDGTVFYAVTIENSDTIALIKVNVNVDAAEDLENWLNEDGESGGEQPSGEGESIPDDNISQYSNGDDDSADTE